MRTSHILFLALLVCFLGIDHVLSHPKRLKVKKPTKPNRPTIAPKKRPAFVHTGPLQDLKKTNSMKRRILRNSATGTTLHLAHVFPWSSINACVDQYLKNRRITELDNFIGEIFEVDLVAQAPTRWLPGGRPDPTSRVTHDQYLRSTDATRSVVGTGTAKPTMLDQNTKMEQMALTARRNGNINELKKYLNSAPANLRFGEATANVAVNDRLDPMGNLNERLTAKESRLLDRYEACGLTDKEWFDTDINGIHIPSSSSVNGLISDPYNLG